MTLLKTGFILLTLAMLVVLTVYSGIYSSNISNQQTQINQLVREHAMFCNAVAPQIPMESELHAIGC